MVLNRLTFYVLSGLVRTVEEINLNCRSIRWRRSTATDDGTQKKPAIFLYISQAHCEMVQKIIQSYPTRHDKESERWITAPPTKKSYSSVSERLMGQLDRQVSEMLTNGVINYSISPFSSPEMPNSKTPGDNRLGIDLRALNKVILGDAHYMNRSKKYF